MNAGKIILIAIWILCASGFVITPSDAVFATWARYAFWLMLAAHALECALFFSKLQNAAGSISGHLFNTLLFGVLHIRDLSAASAEEESG